MDAKLYTSEGGLIGTVEVPSMRAFPLFLYLDEAPKGGTRLFMRSSSSTDQDATYAEVNVGNIPVVKLP